jgi:hypothetical protein
VFPIRIYLLILPLMACSAAAPLPSFPSEDFFFDDAVRITSPSNGATVSSPFTLSWEAGDDVDQVQVEVRGELTHPPTRTGTDGVGDWGMTLDDGRYTLSLQGLNDAGEPISEHEVVVRVATDETPWVTLVSPKNGAHATNPVTFVVAHSDDVDKVEILADGWSLGEVNDRGLLTYSFTGTGFPRDILATAFDEGTAIAEDEMRLTVTEGVDLETSSYNDQVTGVLEGYPTDGSYGYYWPEEGSWPGTTRDVWYLDLLLANGDPFQRSYCVGLTWEVFMGAYDMIRSSSDAPERMNGMDVDDMMELRVDWYVRELYGTGVVDAVERFGLGHGVTDFEDVRPGDFLQFWRNSGSGHSAVFIDWERDAGDSIEGVWYWSTQGSTDGVGYNLEYFGSGESDMDPAHFHAARILTPDDW